MSEAKRGLRGKVLEGLAALVAGGLFSLGFLPAPGGFAGAALCALGLALLFLCIGHAASARGCALRSLLFGLAANSAGLFWVWNSLHVYGGIPAPLAAAGVLALAFANALFPAAAGFAAGKLSGSGPRRILLFALLFFFADWLRGDALCSFPWVSFGYALSGLAPARLIAPLAGAWGVELAGILFVAIFATLFVIKNSKSQLSAAAALVVMAMLACLPAPRWSEPGDALQIRIVQPALPIAGVPGAPSMPFAERIARALALSSFENGAQPPAKRLVVWPESVIPALIQEIPGRLLDPIADAVRKSGTPLVFNAFWLTSAGGVSNSLFLASPDAPLQRYDKRHLVPFGEYVPTGFRWLVDALHIPMGDQTPGAPDQKPLLFRNTVIAPMICYENLFGDELRAFWKRAESPAEIPGMLLVSSNLGWFSPAVEHQHLQMSRMRAIETARPLVSASNNGLSAVIDPQGRVIAALGEGAGSLEVRLEAAAGGTTPYSRLGDAPALLLALALLAALLAAGRRANAKRAASI